MAKELAGVPKKEELEKIVKGIIDEPKSPSSRRHDHGGDADFEEIVCELEYVGIVVDEDELEQVLTSMTKKSIIKIASTGYKSVRK